MFAAYALRRLLDSIPVLLGVTVISFALIQLTAGSSTPGIEANLDVRAEHIAKVRHQLGLDQPWYLQYFNWLGVAWILRPFGLAAPWGDHVTTGLLQGDLGRSLIDGSPIAQHLWDRLPNTLELTLTAIFIGVAIAIPIGVIGALRRGSRLDHAFTALSISGVAVPHFWLGLMLILVFAVTLQGLGLPWLPSGGAESLRPSPDPLSRFADRVEHLVLPATVLAFGYLAVWSRYLRSSMLEVLGNDYVRTARAKGMSERRVVYVHVLRNAVVPLVTLVGLELPGILSGGAITEIVFSWPGIGRYGLNAFQSDDFTVVIALVLVGTALTIAGNLLADLLYAILDPRIRYT